MNVLPLFSKSVRFKPSCLLTQYFRLMSHTCYSSSTALFKRNLLEKLDSLDLKFAPYFVNSEAAFSNSFPQNLIGLDPHLLNNDNTRLDEPIISKPDKNFNTHQIGFKTLFQDGLRKLQAYTESESDTNNIDVPLEDEVNMGLPILSLMRFLMDKGFHEECLYSLIDSKDLESVSDTATVFAVHLFSQLVLNDEPSYRVSDEYVSSPNRCPCEDARCRKKIMYGNTSIGTSTPMYVQPDIVLFPGGTGSTNIVILDQSDNSRLEPFDSDEVHKDDMKENTTFLRSEENVRQASTVAIMSSFYQRFNQDKINRRKRLSETDNPAITTLVPTLAVSAYDFDIYMYDTQHDIFLRNVGNPIELWEYDTTTRRPSLNLTSILYIWMLVNHRSFKLEIPAGVLEIFKETGEYGKPLSADRLKLIENMMKMPWHRRRAMEDALLEKATKIELGKFER